MKNYAILTWNIIKSRIVRPVIYFFGVFLIIVFVFDSFLMPWFVNRGGTQKVPNVIGMKKELAMKFLDSLHLEPREGEVRADNSYPEGYVVGQNPLSDQIVKSGRRVYITISGGELPAIVPMLRGRSLRDAKFVLDRNGLRQGSISYAVSLEFPEGTIITQDIPAETKIKRNSFVSVTVSAGESIDSIIVPSLIGRTLAEAQKILKGKGLNVGNITYQIQQELLPNTVIDQFPRENQVVTFEKGVDLFIAQAPDKNKPLREN